MGEYMGGIGLGDAMILASRNNGYGSNGQWDNPLNT